MESTRSKKKVLGGNLTELTHFECLESDVTYEMDQNICQKF
jgi:hypothetical protein